MIKLAVPFCVPGWTTVDVVLFLIRNFVLSSFWICICKTFKSFALCSMMRCSLFVVFSAGVRNSLFLRKFSPLPYMFGPMWFSSPPFLACKLIIRSPDTITLIASGMFPMKPFKPSQPLSLELLSLSSRGMCTEIKNHRVSLHVGFH